MNIFRVLSFILKVLIHWPFFKNCYIERQVIVFVLYSSNLIVKVLLQKNIIIADDLEDKFFGVDVHYPELPSECSWLRSSMTRVPMSCHRRQQKIVKKLAYCS